MKATIRLQKQVGKYKIVSNSVMDFEDAREFFNHEDFVSSHHHHHKKDSEVNLNNKFNGFKPR